MTIKIECEAHELAEWFARVDMSSAERGAACEQVHVLKDRVYQLERQLSEKAAPIQGHHDPENVKLLIRAVSTGQKIAAIKAVRAMLDLGLKDAKDFVEAEWGKVVNW